MLTTTITEDSVLEITAPEGHVRVSAGGVSFRPKNGRQWTAEIPLGRLEGVAALFAAPVNETPEEASSDE